MTTLQRLMQRIKAQSERGCWEWNGTRNNRGYGEISVDHLKELAHRVSWELHFGPIPEGLCVLHRCDNPPCINPFHLFLGNLKDNIRDMFGKERNGWSSRPWPDDFPCVKGHAPNWARNNRGHRYCKSCRTILSKKRWQAMKAARK
jgi:hypothetical protein